MAAMQRVKLKGTSVEMSRSVRGESDMQISQMCYARVDGGLDQ